jgi:hypothetical protein
MRIQSRTLIAMLTAMALLIGSVSAARTDTIVRGKLYRVGSGGTEIPAAGIGVSLNNPQRGASATAYSGSDGLYYIYNVPPGRYVLEVRISKSEILKYDIEAKDQKYTDIGPIRVE